MFSAGELVGLLSFVSVLFLVLLLEGSSGVPRPSVFRVSTLLAREKSMTLLL